MSVVFLHRYLLKVYTLQALLLGMGLQHKVVDSLSSELDLPVSQLLGLFNRSTRRIVNFLVSLLERSVEESMVRKSSLPADNLQPLSQSLSAEMEQAATVSKRTNLHRCFYFTYGMSLLCNDLFVY